MKTIIKTRIVSECCDAEVRFITDRDAMMICDNCQNDCIAITKSYRNKKQPSKKRVGKN